ncbi:TIGR03111 family XrtG-associated glycosyltransferase [Syntrophomonas palmitatica]|uniref:TIGR03111 family XrtG-associated glycosyltransferase n=1 Tax=Syntrophomonas palmitatica TaxID=402877 RepID=UPI0006D07FBE|nr:TIGR03111 family XrtG-associated glycosyltransferase [Syntrophomonas palmitatica]
MLDVFWERSLAFLLFWGIWMLAPLAIDVTIAIAYLIMVMVFPEKKERENIPDLAYLPYVSVVIPVHNSAETLFQCLLSVINQKYPLDKIQIICVNNGSSDNSFEIYSRFQDEYPLVSSSWINMDRSGKSIALNAGIYAIKGDYVINVDSDAWLDELAILRMAEAFEHDPSLAAATGAIHIDKELGDKTSFIDVVHYCEEIEYLVAFNVGRRYQSLTNNLFTLAGAFSAFRRDVILNSFMYSERTVSEDTDLTFHIRNRTKINKSRMACISSSIAYVEPITSMSKLYSQRVRWQRGQIEVTSLYSDVSGRFYKGLQSYAGRILVADHTLAFSRLTWTFLVPFLYFLGYPLKLVFAAFVGLYVCYLFLDFLYFLVAVRESIGDYKNRIKKIWWVIFFLPIFRFFTYWFRVSGIILSLTEEASWKTEDPVTQLKSSLRQTRRVLVKRIRCWRGADNEPDKDVLEQQEESYPYIS